MIFRSSKTRTAKYVAAKFLLSYLPARQSSQPTQCLSFSLQTFKTEISIHYQIIFKYWSD